MVLINFISTSDCHCIPLSTSLVPQFLKMKHQRVESWDFLRPEVYFQFRSKKSVVGRKKFGTLENPTVLEDPLMSTNKIVIDLLWHTTSIAIPSHTSLDQEPAVLRPVDFAEFRRKELFTFLVIEQWGPTQLLANSLYASKGVPTPPTFSHKQVVNICPKHCSRHLETYLQQSLLQHLYECCKYVGDKSWTGETVHTWPV